MINRDPESGKFLPGNKSNPGGRPKSDLSITALIDKAVSADDWDFIFASLLKKARRGDLKAIEMLLDRRFGKAVQQTTLSDPNGDAVKINVTINGKDV
jgi:hypothetical protein